MLSSLLLALLPMLLLLKWHFLKHRSPSRKLQAPSPPRLPVIGNLHQVGIYPYRCLQSLAKCYGPLMLFHLGGAPAFVVSSAEAVKEVLKTHDLSFSSRLDSIISRKVMYKDVIMAPYGEYWRQTRSLCVAQLLSTSRVKSIEHVRDEEIEMMIERIKAFNSSSFNLSALIEKVSIDIMCRACIGRKVEGEGTQRHFNKIFEEFNSLLGVFNIEEYIPWLGWINHFNGLNKRIEKCHQNIDHFLEEMIIGGDLERDHGAGEEKYLLDVLLDAQDKDDSITRDSVKGVLIDMFAGGIDTTYVVMEWTMAELIRHPQILKKVQDEIREVVGGKTLITTHDLGKMSYLKASIKEAMRLYPPFPILPRVSSEDVDVLGYTIPANTRILISAWAVGRDSASWEHPDEFRPERFLLGDNPSIDFQVHDFKWIAFGGGRRGCPGMSYGILLVEHVLACLLHNFNWSLPGNEKAMDLDMTEFVAFSLHKMHPLIVVATPYNCS